MKGLVVILLIAGVLVQQFSKTIIVADYIVHRDYIAANLCENRNNPGMHCNGKCHLHKELANDDKRQGSDNKSVNPNDDMTVWEFSRTSTYYNGSRDAVILLCADADREYVVQRNGLLRPPCA